MSPMFKSWGFAVIRGPQPDFVLKDDKKFCVSVLKNHYDDPMLILVDKYLHRFSSIKLDLPGVLLSRLKWCSANFTNLTSLDLASVHFDNASLLVLAPQLENLRLNNIENVFDVSTVNEESKCFTRLKTLELIYTNVIDAKKILSKSSKTLECLVCDTVQQNYGFNDLVVELSSLKKLLIYIDDEMSARNLISKCSGSLRTLELMDIFGALPINLCSLLVQSMSITTLVIEPTLGTNVEILLSKCPLIQNLSILFYDSELKEVFLNDLKELKLFECGDVCMTSAVNNIFKTSKASVKILHLETEDKIECEFTEIPGMDTVWCSRKDMGSEELVKILNLFPRKSEVIF